MKYHHFALRALSRVENGAVRGGKILDAQVAVVAIHHGGDAPETGFKMPDFEFRAGSVIVGDECRWQEMPIAEAVKSTVKLGDKVVFNDAGLLVPLCDQFKDRPTYTVIAFEAPRSPVEAAALASVFNPKPKPPKKSGWEFLGAP